MSDKIKDGGPAFPCPVGHIECAHPEGMSLRDWFAGQALVALLPNPSAAKICDPKTPFAEHIAKMAYEMADAMLAARERKP